MKMIQLASVVPDRDCTLKADLEAVGALRMGAVDCNRLPGMVVEENEYDRVLTALAQKGWHRVAGERGGPEGLSVSWLDNPTIIRTPPWRSPDMEKYLANRRG